MIAGFQLDLRQLSGCQRTPNPLLGISAKGQKPTSRRLHGKVDLHPVFTLWLKHLNLSERRALLR